MDGQTFDAAREAFLYHVATDTQTPQERADNFGWYTVEGNLEYAPGIVNGSYERIGPRARSAIRCRRRAPLSRQARRRRSARDRAAKGIVAVRPAPLCVVAAVAALLMPGRARGRGHRRRDAKHGERGRRHDRPPKR